MYVWAIAVGFPASDEAPKLTGAVMPEEHVVPVTVPLAQYVKESVVAVDPEFGVYVKVPFAQIPATGLCGRALQLSVPLVGAVSSATP